MQRPEFSRQEEYLIDLCRHPEWFKTSSAFMWTYLSCGAILTGFAVAYQNFPLLVSAFVVVFGFRIYEEWYQQRWHPVWQSIIEKYEAAFENQERLDE